MKKKNLVKITTIMIVFTILFNTIPLLEIVFSNRVVAAELDIDGSLPVVLSEEVLSDDFDLEEAAEEIPSVDEMTEDERILFEQLVEEQLELLGKNQDENFEQTLIDFFDDSSEISGDLEKAQETLSGIDSEDINNISSMSILPISFMNAKSKLMIRASNKFAGATINILIGLAIGGGVGAIKSFIVKKGKKEATRVFTKTVKSRLIAWGAPKLAKSVGVAVAYALQFLDFGYYIAVKLDKMDKRPNSGFVDFY